MQSHSLVILKILEINELVFWPLNVLDKFKMLHCLPMKPWARPSDYKSHRNKNFTSSVTISILNIKNVPLATIAN